MRMLKTTMQCLLVTLLLVLGATACVRPTDTELRALDEAKNYVSRQQTVLQRTGPIRSIVYVDASVRGRSMPFGWGDRSEEQYVLRVEGDQDTIATRVTLRRTPKTPWAVTDWGILSANDAAQYLPNPTPAH